MSPFFVRICRTTSNLLAPKLTDFYLVLPKWNGDGHLWRLAMVLQSMDTYKWSQYLLAHFHSSVFYKILSGKECADIMQSLTAPGVRSWNSWVCMNGRYLLIFWALLCRKVKGEQCKVSIDHIKDLGRLWHCFWCHDGESASSSYLSKCNRWKRLRSSNTSMTPTFFMNVSENNKVNKDDKWLCLHASTPMLEGGTNPYPTQIVASSLIHCKRCTTVVWSCSFWSLVDVCRQYIYT